MYTIHLSNEELQLARNAMQAYLRTFGHNEADTVDQIRRVIAKLAAAEIDDEAPVPPND